MRTSAPRGMALVTALLVAMVVFLICNAMTALARQELRLTQAEARNLQKLYLAQGVANEILVRLQLGDDPTLFPAENPTVFPSHDLNLDATGWVVQDANFPEVFHVHALVDGQHYTLTTSREKSPEPVTFAGLTQGYFPELGVTSFFVQRDGGGQQWKPLPAIPETVYSKGAGSPNPPDPSRSTVSKHYVADDQGHLYAEQYSPLEGETIYRYDYQTDSWTPLPPIPEVIHTGYTPIAGMENYIDSTGEQFGAGNGWNVSRDGTRLALPVNLNLTPQGGAINGEVKPAGAYLCTLDLEGEQSNWLVSYQAGYDQINEVAFGGQADEIYTVSVADIQDRNSTTILRGPNWQPLPTVRVSGRDLPFLRDLTVGPEGDLYAVATDRNSLYPHIVKYDQQGWTALPPANDSWQSAPHRASLTSLSIDSDGRLTFVEREPDLEEPETFYHQNGEGWEAVSALPFNRETCSWSHVGGGILDTNTYSYQRKASF